MSRKHYIPLLKGTVLTLRQLAHLVRLRPGEVAEDLQHLEKSLVHSEWRIEVQPARCRKCDFVFGADKFQKPSKCPECRGTWLTEPEFGIVAREPPAG